MPTRAQGPIDGHTYDFVVVGGGTSGSILAARLSDEPGNRVLLLEAGPDLPDSPPPELARADHSVLEGYNWSFEAVVSERTAGMPSDRAGRVARVFEIAAEHLGGDPGPVASPTGVGGAQETRFPYPLGKILGGGSAVNGALALQARPEDWDAWPSNGSGGWSWREVEPWARRLERGGDGVPPLPLETTGPGDLVPWQASFVDACRALGREWTDLRSGTREGVGALPRSVDGGRRMPTSRIWLEGARARGNLKVATGTLVDRLVLEREGSEGLRATGVEAIRDGKRERYACGRVVLAAGAVQSPAVLLRSGVGPADGIVRAGGAPRLDLPGVGRNLADHPAVLLWGVPKEGTWGPGEPAHQAMAQWRSSRAGALCDLQTFMLGAVSTRPYPTLRSMAAAELAVAVSAVVATPRSRGRVELAGVDPTLAPRIYLDCLSDPVDMERMLEGVRAAWAILSHPRMRRDLERTVLWSESVVASDALLASTIRSTVRTTWHPVGTLAMGKGEDAVCDLHGRLRGCHGVTVADASLLPTIPSVPTALTCMLVAGRIADQALAAGGAR